MKEISAKIVLSSRKVHKCSMCLEDIPTGCMYFSHTFTEKEKIEKLKVCIICEYLLTETPGGKVKRGNFSERMIPNCLRKKRAELIKHPEKFMERFQKYEENITVQGTL
jgi:hypothetical protein